MKGKPHEHQTSTDDFHAKVQQIHGPVAETFLRAHLVMMHGASAPITDQVWDGLVVTHRQLHQEVPVSAPSMPVPHTHSAPGEDLVTYHAAHSVIQVRRHLEREHGISEAQALTNHGVLLRHATIHAVQLTEQQQAVLSDRDKRSYMAGNLRRIAQVRLDTEVEHASLPMPYDQDPIEIVALEEIRDWLLGLATRIENGTDL